MKKIVLLTPLLVLSSCSFFHETKEQSVNLSSVTDVYVSGNILLKITHASESKLEVQASDAVLAELSIETQGSKLEIKDKYKPTHDPVVVTLSIPELHQVHVSGAIKGQINRINTDVFSLMGSGVINLKLSGQTNMFNVSASGSIKIDASNLISDAIDAHGSGTGHILYKGNPVIKKSLSGSAQLIQK
jgi:hypothetical protein